jgi:hypothetical protein
VCNEYKTFYTPGSSELNRNANCSAKFIFDTSDQLLRFLNNFAKRIGENIGVFSPKHAPFLSAK